MAMRLAQSGRASPLARSLLRICAVYQMALGGYFMFVRPTLLPEDERAMGTTLESLVQAAPGFATWANRVLTVLGGQAAAGGFLLFLATMLLQREALSPAAAALLVAAGGASVALMSIATFLIGSVFRWALVVPIVVWAAAVSFLFRGGTDLAVEVARCSCEMNSRV